MLAIRFVAYSILLIWRSPMTQKKSNDQYSDEEATRRMNEALRRALTSPPKPQSEMKIGKRKAEKSAKTSSVPNHVRLLPMKPSNGKDK
jgi:hypothetical protein